MRAGTRATKIIDKVIGHNIHIRRHALGLSQQELAEHLGVTAQQVQKYEKGTNRVAGNRLWELGKLFKVPVQNFYEGVEKYEVSASASPLALIAKRDAFQLLQAFAKITKPSLRRTVVSLVAQIID